jgi:Flp pilus assembly protein TadB
VVYGSCWLLFSIALLATALIFIPCHEKYLRQASIIAAERSQSADSTKTISLARVLLGSCGLGLLIIVNLVNLAQGRAGETASQVLLTALLVCLMLMFFAMDPNVRRFIADKTSVQFKQLAHHCCQRKTRVSPIEH